jgi:hypothetical protein
MSLSMSKVLQPLTTEGALAWSDQPGLELSTTKPSPERTLVIPRKIVCFELGIKMLLDLRS